MVDTAVDRLLFLINLKKSTKKYNNNGLVLMIRFYQWLYFTTPSRTVSGLFFSTRFGFRSLFFSPVRAKNVFIRVFLRSKLLLFGPVLGPIYKGGFDFSEFNLIFLGLIIQEIKFLV